VSEGTDLLPQHKGEREGSSHKLKGSGMWNSGEWKTTAWELGGGEGANEEKPL